MTKTTQTPPVEAVSVDHFEFIQRHPQDNSQKRPLVGGDALSTRLAGEQVVQTLIDQFIRNASR